VARDGVMQGPAFELYDSILKKFPDICVLASGGVRHIEDIDRLNDMGVFAVIFGKAFYEGKIKLKDLEKYIAKTA
jgi:phosphoribosylformimino-5-aminoimidazole carboxamide ribotide isomerase